VAGFWLSAMAKFFKARGATVPYSVMVAPHVGLYGGFLALRHGPPSAINNTVIQQAQISSRKALSNALNLVFFSFVLVLDGLQSRLSIVF
jgi:hypothetical protein